MNRSLFERIFLKRAGQSLLPLPALVNTTATCISLGAELDRALGFRLTRSRPLSGTDDLSVSRLQMDAH